MNQVNLEMASQMEEMLQTNETLNAMSASQQENIVLLEEQVAEQSTSIETLERKIANQVKKGEKKSM